MNRVISIGTRSDSDKGSGFHEHNYWEFVYYYNCWGTVSCAGQEYAYHPHTLVCFPPGVAHCEYPDGKISNIYFLTDAEPSDKHKIILYEDNTMHEMENLVTQLRYHYHRNVKNRRELLHAILTLIVELIHAKGAIDDTQAYVEAAESVIIANLTDSQFDINRIYEKIPMSKVYFASLFKKQTGLTPVDYLIHIRIENAKTLLIEREFSNSRISEIARLSGFDDSYYFSRVFKKRTGSSPLNWIKEHKDDY